MISIFLQVSSFYSEIIAFYYPSARISDILWLIFSCSSSSISWDSPYPLCALGTWEATYGLIAVCPYVVGLGLRARNGWAKVPLPGNAEVLIGPHRSAMPTGTLARPVVTLYGGDVKFRDTPAGLRSA